MKLQCVTSLVLKHDKSLNDIMHNDKPFGGKVIVFCGDFHQILPVVPRGSHSDIVHASLNASYI